MTRLPRTLRLDPSDTLIFERAAEPGEWAVPGGFAFWDEDPAAMPGRRRQAFRAGFLGLTRFGWSTLVEVAEASAASAAAEEEVGFAESLCADHPPGTVLALSRTLDEGGAVRERFRTLSRRPEAPHRDFGALPVFGVVEVEEEDAPVERPDLAALGRGSGGA